MYCIGTGNLYIAAKPDNFLYTTEKLDEARKQLLKDKERSGSGDRLKKLRRIAMVFSVPEQGIVLSEDV